MHISDGVLSGPVWIGSYAVAAAIAAISFKKMKPEDMPRMAVMTSAFFVASLIHFPLGPTSIHLILNGLVGIVLGPMAFVSILIGLSLQAFLFQDGGITAIGANAIMMGLPALVAHSIFSLRRRFRLRAKEAVFGFLAGASAVFLGTIILSFLLLTTGREFIGVAKLAVLAHLPIMAVEGIVIASVASFLKKVKPEILERNASSRDR